MLLLAKPTTSLAQSDSTQIVGATLRGWEDQAWLAIFDRSGSFFGRTSEHGILQRFNERMDQEYLLDLISFGFTLDQSFDWHRRDSGARAWAGSINHLQLVGYGEFKATVPLGTNWAAGARFDQQETLSVKRSLMRLWVRHDLFADAAQAYLLTTVKNLKPEWDFELGFIWRAGPGDLRLAIGALDPFSDLIFEGLEVKATISDTILDYTAHPFTARVTADLELAKHLRLEAYGLVLTPTTVIIESQSTGTGFGQEERYAYAGGLIEWSPSTGTAVGGLGTWVRARTDREPLPDGSADDDFELMEKTWRLGLYAIKRLRRWTSQAWLAHAWRDERRLRPSGSAEPTVDFADRIWTGNAQVAYRATSGFRGELAFSVVAPRIISEDRLPGSSDRTNARLRLDLGWHFGDAALFVVGSNLDLDGDGKSPNFDGGHGRFVLYW
ncbi:MAG: hypothetical protein JSU87_16230 [Gemmatimonadota bacterium]|nr:MAG: hypothetical protein JSU87_16230 [Gemmatimonadota bacterium]